jgi:predicted small secreted protein
MMNIALLVSGSHLSRSAAPVFKKVCKAMKTLVDSQRMKGLLVGAALALSLLLAACSTQTGATTDTPVPTSAPTRAQPTHTPTKPPTPTPPTGTGLFGGKNLIVNGDAESGPGTMDGSTPVTNIPGWTPMGNFDVVVYGASGGYPLDTDPGPTDRGKNFFSGGPDDDVSTGTQIIDVSSVATMLDTGAVSYTLSGWLGGYADQNDNATLTIQFQDASGKTLGQGQFGPVMAADRNNVTSFIQKTAQGNAPKGTRKILVTLTMTRTDGSANDGYADNLSLTLAGGTASIPPANLAAFSSGTFSGGYPNNWQAAIRDRQNALTPRE